MGFACGIVGLPNVGKSTLFSAITSVKAQASNFPFTTIDPNVGIVRIPDARLDRIGECFNQNVRVPATATFVDIAGLVKGASKGEGLGNQFLAHIRESQAIAHVVRCFEDPNIIHVAGSVDPMRDVEIINTELMLADLDAVTKRYPTIEKSARAGASKEAITQFAVLSKVRAALEAGHPVRSLNLDENELAVVKDFFLITSRKVMYIANVGDDDSANPAANPHVKKLMDYAATEGAPVIPICGKIESEIAELDEAEKAKFLTDYGMAEPGLNRVKVAGYDLLGLQTFFTAGDIEIKAWTIKKGMRAPQAAGVIHSDFERGFIRAEVYTYDDLMKYKNEDAIKAAGLMRLEGKAYVVKDGDIMVFRFAV